MSRLLVYFLVTAGAISCSKVEKSKKSETEPTPTPVPEESTDRTRVFFELRSSVGLLDHVSTTMTKDSHTKVAAKTIYEVFPGLSFKKTHSDWQAVHSNAANTDVNNKLNAFSELGFDEFLELVAKEGVSLTDFKERAGQFKNQVNALESAGASAKSPGELDMRYRIFGLKECGFINEVTATCQEFAENKACLLAHHTKLCEGGDVEIRDCSDTRHMTLTERFICSVGTTLWPAHPLYARGTSAEFALCASPDASTDKIDVAIDGVTKSYGKVPVAFPRCRQKEKQPPKDFISCRENFHSPYLRMIGCTEIYRPDAAKMAAFKAECYDDRGLDWDRLKTFENERCPRKDLIVGCQKSDGNRYDGKYYYNTSPPFGWMDLESKDKLTYLYKVFEIEFDCLDEKENIGILDPFSNMPEYFDEKYNPDIGPLEGPGTVIFDRVNGYPMPSPSPT